MSIDPRISRLLELVQRDLCVESLDSLTAEFYSLARDRVPSLPFFAMAAVCDRLASALEREPPRFDRWQDITSDVRGKITTVVLALREGRDATSDMEDLVQTILRKVGA
jgi:hypothetical protein